MTTPKFKKFNIEAYKPGKSKIKKLKIEGTGLGLAITKHILNQHKGELKITSKEGKGSEFTVLLPLIS